MRHWLLLASMLVPAVAGSPLQQSRSAYLRAAAAQPVHWHSWSSAAFEEARTRNVPVLLDVGASWCSWCSLMDRESYTHKDLADFINQHFVPVKVDYDADPAFTRSLERAAAVANLPLGVPLTLFLTPHKTIYFGGRYFPARPTADKRSFRQALDFAWSEFQDHPKALEANGAATLRSDRDPQ